MRRQRSNSVEDAPNGKSGFKQVGFFLHQNRFKLPLKNMANALIVPIDIMGIRTIEQFHTVRQNWRDLFQSKDDSDYPPQQHSLQLNMK